MGIAFFREGHRSIDRSNTQKKKMCKKETRENDWAGQGRAEHYSNANKEKAGYARQSIDRSVEIKNDGQIFNTSKGNSSN